MVFIKLAEVRCPQKKMYFTVLIQDNEQFFQNLHYFH